MQNLTKKTQIFLCRAFFFSISLIANFFFVAKSHAEISIIREAETEEFLREICQPIFKIAGLNPKNIRIYIVNDDSINAFVSGGQNIFINTGLIKKFSNPEVISGVIAHEVGHIASGHLAKSSEMFNETASATIAGYILGIGAIASGRADVGSAIILGSSHINNRLALKYTRSQEESADILALDYLNKLNISNEGLLEIMEYFNKQTLGANQQINSYELTHPMSSSRILLIKNYSKEHAQKKSHANKNISKKLEQVQAKLAGFLDETDGTLKQLEKLNDENSMLTKAIIYHRINNFDESYKIIDDLIKTNPKNGFLYELKAEFFFNQANLFESIIYYRKAIDLLDANAKTLAQISIANAIAQLNTNDDFLLNLALKHLLEAQKIENENLLLYKTLAQIYSQQNARGKALLAMAEYNYLLQEYEKTKKLATEALGYLEKCQENSAEKLLENSSQNSAENLQKECKKEGDGVAIIRARDLIAISENSNNKKPAQ